MYQNKIKLSQGATTRIAYKVGAVLFIGRNFEDALARGTHKE